MGNGDIGGPRWAHLLDDVSRFAASGTLHLAIGVLLAIWIAAARRRRRWHSESADYDLLGFDDDYELFAAAAAGDDDESDPIADGPTTRKRHRAAAPVLPYELLAQVTRAAALALLVTSSTPSDALLVAYVFVLGLLRLFGSPRWQVHARRQRNFVTASSIVVLALEHGLPCAKMDTACSPLEPPRLGTILLVLSGLAGLITPVSRDPDDVPEEQASWWARWVSYSWINPLMMSGLAGQAPDVQDLVPLPMCDRPDAAFGAVRWAQGKDGRNSMVRTLWRISRWHLSGCAFFLSASYLLDNVTPVGLYGLLHDLTEPDQAVLSPWAWLLLMFCGSMGRTLASHAGMFFSARNGVRIKAGFAMELHARAMGCHEDENQDAAAAATTRSGRISNLMAADLDSLWRLRSVLELVFGIIPGTAASLLWMLYVLGWAALPGAAIVVLVIPASAILGGQIRTSRSEARAAQDRRISSVGEFLGSIRAVKYFAWEDVVVERASSHRQAEQDASWRVSTLKRVMGLVVVMLPLVAIIVMFYIDGFVQGQPLTAAKAYTVVFLIKQLRQYYDQVPTFTMQIMGVKVALDRLDRFFSTTHRREKVEVGPLSIQNGSFLLGRPEESAAGPAGFTLEDVSIDFVEGGLNVVTGVSGSGKTALLLSILGETRRLAGKLTRPLDAAFASQTPWVRRGPIRESILFYSPMEPARYAAVLDACCLQLDLKSLPLGDQTVVGEGGAGLSGGQKARVALARALYSRAPLLLLDDVFSALDTRTAAVLWERCFCSDLLKGRTVVLVSQVPWMSSQADLAVVMDRGRTVSVQSNPGVLRRPVTRSEAKQLARAQDANDDSRSDSTHTNPTSSSSENGEDETDTETEVESVAATPAVSGQGQQRNKAAGYATTAIVREEIGESGRVSRFAIFKYVAYLGPRWYVAMIGLLLVLVQATWFAQTLWISHWVDQPTAEKLSHMGFYLFVYALVSFAEPFMRYCFQWAIDAGAWQAARKLHLNLVRSVTRVSLSWHARIPVGRIVNRFSRDMNTIDWELRPIVEALFSESISFLFRVGAVISVLPVFVVPCTVMCILGAFVCETFARTVAYLRRMESSAQSPVFSIFQDSLSGLEVIRAHAHGPRATARELSEALELAATSRATILLTYRWLGVRIGFLAAAVTVAAGAMAIAKSSVVAAGLIGLALTSTTALNSTVFEIILQITSLETEMQKFDRVEEYTNLPPEESSDEYPPDDNLDRDLTSWPEDGAVEFNNVCVSYTPDSPDVLRNINLTFKAGERVAIVGRTGSGKSTLALTLLHFTHISSGQVLFSGRDITSMPRRKLRSSIALIPQEPVLLAGTVMWNLDPTGTVSPTALASAVRSCSEVGTSSMEAWADPNARVGPAGENLSHGQRQVLALARALARQSQLVVLDEATANMDYETDKGIQRVLRWEVRGGGGRTLITIAHRLRTIVDYDKVVVMGGGQVLEVGSPRELYVKKGAFYDMVHHSGEAAGLEEALAGTAAGGKVVSA